MQKFNRIYIEITNACNMSCSFCVGNTRQTKLMTKEQFEHIILDVKQYTKYIYLHVLGEPLSHPQLNSLLDIADEHKMHVNITTNGTLLKITTDVLLNHICIRKISISLHSIEKGSINDNKDYLVNVFTFIKNAASNNIICEIRLWNIGGDNKYNNTTVLPLFKLMDIENIEEISSTLNNTGNIKLYPNIYLGKSEQFKWPDINDKPTNKSIICHGTRNQLAILVDGTVVPCCLDSKGEINLGNIFNQSLDSIIKSKRTKAIYNGFSNRLATEELCKRCEYATRFK